MRKIRVALSWVVAILVLSTMPAVAVELGEKAPDFELPSTKDGKLKLNFPLLSDFPNMKTIEAYGVLNPQSKLAQR